jgi:ribonucleoside-diphosphate reductase beta chain
VAELSPDTVHLHDPQTLYEHWEREQWSPWDVDLAADARNWRGKLTEQDRGLVLWALSSLMVAEERITTKFAGLVMAADSEEETTFLATQQVDEARHMQFYARFQNEVIAEPATIAAHVARSREQLGDSFKVIFDEALVQAHERLAADPRDAAAKVEFVTTYHLIIEATLGLTAFNFITHYLSGKEALPGFAEGYGRIHHDEQRHIGFGVWFLRQAVSGDPALGDRLRQTLRDLLPAVSQALAPPGEADTDWDALGASADEVRAFALDGLTRRLSVIGVPLSSL